MRPHRWQPTKLPRPWDSPGKNTGVGCHFLLQCMKVKSESDVAQSFPTLTDPMVCSLPGSSVCGIFHAGVGCHCLLRQVKEESVKVGLKLNIQKTKFKASGPITSRQIDGKIMEQWLTLYFWAPKSLQMVTTAMKLKDVCSLEEKQKAGHYFSNRGPSSQSNGFSSSHVWKWELDYKETESRRIEPFELWCWGRLLRVPWTARRSHQSIIKEINSEYSLEELMLKLKLQYFGHLRQRVNSLGKILMLGKIEGRREGNDRGWDG